MSESRSIIEAPRLAPDVRTQMLGALYDAAYSQTMPRERFDTEVAGKSDMDIADATFRQFYDGRIDRQDFNRRVGLTSAQGSTRAAIMQGLSFGLSDEILAGGTGAMQGLLGMLRGEGTGGFRQGYNDALTAQRQNLEVFRQNNPYVGRGLEFVGGLASGGAGVAAAPSAARTIGTAATVGAVGGFGQGEGVEDRLAGAATGAALGAGVATVLPPVVRAGAGVVGRAGQALGFGNSDDIASRMLLRAMQDDGLTPAEAMRRMNQWRDTGAKPETLFDLAGENTRRLARTAAGRTGPGTDRAVTFLTERQEGQAGRIADDAAAGLGQSADDFFTRRQALVQQRSTTAQPLYERAFRIQVQPDEYARVARFVDDPIGQEALRKGLRVIELEHVAQGRQFDPAAFGVQRVNGEFVPVDGQTPNMRLLDAVKRGFDEIVEGFRDSTSGRLNLNQYGRAVDSARAAYRNELAGMFPPYRRALEAWSGPSQSMDAMARGRNIFNMRDSEAAQAAVSVRRSPSEAEFFRLGVAQAIQERIAGAPDGADAVKRIFGSAAKRALLRAAFPDDASFNRFVAQMRREDGMFRNAQFVSPRTGSQTQLRESDASEFGTDAALAVASGMLPGRTVAGAVADFGRAGVARARGVTPQVADSLSRRLFNAETPEVVSTLRQLGQQRIRQAAEEETARRLRASALARLTAGSTAALE
jgi:hypothetical protein